MKVFILLFLFIVVTCQAQELTNNWRQVAREGELESNTFLNDQLYEKLKTLAKKYMVNDAGDPNILTLLVPDVFKSSSLRSRELYQRPPQSYDNNGIANPSIHHQNAISATSRINNPVTWSKYPDAGPISTPNRNRLLNSRFDSPRIHGRYQLSEAEQVLQEAQRLQQAQAEQAHRLAQVDRDALSQLSDEDRQLVMNELTPYERETLLTILEDGQLDEILPREENRFGDFGDVLGGLSGTVAQIGATAGGYIGRKLAGTLGAKLGAAAGAYLGAAAASRFVKKVSPAPELHNNGPNNNYSNQGTNQGATNDGFGATMVNNK